MRQFHLVINCSAQMLSINQNDLNSLIKPNKIPHYDWKNTLLLGNFSKIFLIDTCNLQKPISEKERERAWNQITVSHIGCHSESQFKSRINISETMRNTYHGPINFIALIPDSTLTLSLSHSQSINKFLLNSFKSTT